MKLQSRDFVSAWDIQKQLVKLCPKDKTIAAFSQFLPAEAKEQKENEALEGEAEYYDEEEDPADKDEESQEENDKNKSDPAAPISEVTEN